MYHRSGDGGLFHPPRTVASIVGLRCWAAETVSRVRERFRALSALAYVAQGSLVHTKYMMEAPLDLSLSVSHRPSSSVRQKNIWAHPSARRTLNHVPPTASRLWCTFTPQVTPTKRALSCEKSKAGQPNQP